MQFYVIYGFKRLIVVIIFRSLSATYVFTSKSIDDIKISTVFGDVIDRTIRWVSRSLCNYVEYPNTCTPIPVPDHSISIFTRLPSVARQCILKTLVLFQLQSGLMTYTKRRKLKEFPVQRSNMTLRVYIRFFNVVPRRYHYSRPTLFLFILN